MQVAIGVSDLPDGHAAAVRAASVAAKRVPAPTLVVVFASIKLDQARVNEGLRTVFPEAELIGASSEAELSNLGVSVRSVAIAAIELPREAVQHQWGRGVDDERALGETLGRRYCLSNTDEMTAVCLTFCDMTQAVGDRYVRGLRHGFAQSSAHGAEQGAIAFFGGASCVDMQAGQTHYFSRENFQHTTAGAQQSSLSTALLSLPSSRYQLSFGFTHGWTPLSKAVTCTRCEGNYVFEVDGIPILQFYADLLGDDFRRQLNSSFGRYSFLVEFDCHGTAISDVRSPIHIDDARGAIGFYPADSMEGVSVRLVQCSRADVVRGVRKAAEDCWSGLAGTVPQLVLMVSCVVRRQLLNSTTVREFNAVQSVFGTAVPILGYYAGGEIGPLGSAIDRWGQMGMEGTAPAHHATSLCLMAIGAHTATDGGDMTAWLAGEATVGNQDDATTIAELRQQLERCETLLDETEEVLTNICVQNRRVGDELAQAKTLLEKRNIKLIEANDKYRNVQSIIKRYTPHAMWRKAGHSVEQGLYEIENEELVAVFMFLDIKGFTAYADRHRPDEVIAAINRMFEPVTKIIYEYDGDIDKFIGDAILATFERVDDAVEAARTILDRVSSSLSTSDGQQQPFAIRIGINAGRVVLGNVGASQRMDHTLIGDAVNVAQRLESACTPGRVMMSAAVFDQSVAPFAHVERREISVKGKEEMLVVYECW